MQSITSGISTMLVLFLLGTVVFLAITANNLSVFVRENIAVTLTMSDDMKEEQIKAYETQLKKAAYVKSTKYISKQQALKEQTEAMGTDPAEFLGHNPFSATIEVKLKADYATIDSIQKINAILKETPTVIDVYYPELLIDSVNKNIGKASVVLLICAGLLTLISFALINNTIRLSIYAKRFLIYTMTLVGAKWSFIRRPFVWSNIGMGILSALVADAALFGCVRALLTYEPDLAQIITPQVLWIVLGAVLLLGILLTWLCATISVNRYLNMRYHALYK